MNQQRRRRRAWWEPEPFIIESHMVPDPQILTRSQLALCDRAQHIEQAYERIDPQIAGELRRDRIGALTG